MDKTYFRHVCNSTHTVTFICRDPHCQEGCIERPLRHSPCIRRGQSSSIRENYCGPVDAITDRTTAIINHYLTSTDCEQRKPPFINSFMPIDRCSPYNRDGALLLERKGDEGSLKFYQEPHGDCGGNPNRIVALANHACREDQRLYLKLNMP